MVAGLPNPFEVQLLRQSDRSFIRGSNDGPDARRPKIGLSPLQRRSACLGSDPLAMAVGSHDPAHLRLLTEFGFQVPPSVEKADDAEQLTIRPLLDGPHSKAEKLPTPDE